jgi:hypothetical protein
MRSAALIIRCARNSTISPPQFSLSQILTAPFHAGVALNMK